MNARLLFAGLLVVGAGALLDGLSVPSSTARAADCGDWCRERNNFYFCGSSRCFRTFLPTCDRCVSAVNACEMIEAGSPMSCRRNPEDAIVGIKEYTCSGGICACPPNGVWVEATSHGTEIPDVNIPRFNCSGFPGANVGAAPPPDGGYR